MKLFADDALLFRPIKSEKDCKSLQKDLNALETWSKRWKMTFNTSKCHVLRMTGNKTIITQNYKLGNEPLTTVSNHPYLGVEFDSKLSWKVQVQKVKAKGTKTLNMVRRNFTKGTNEKIREQNNIQALSTQHWNTEALPGTLTKQTESRCLRASKTRGRGTLLRNGADTRAFPRLKTN